LWRICSGCGPTRARLQTRYVPCSDIFPLCGNASEDDWHAFVGCDILRECWFWAGLSSVLLKRMDKFDNISDFIFDVFRNEPLDMAGRIAALLWQIWAARNDCVE
jgi:hypothetical protein